MAARAEVAHSCPGMVGFACRCFSLALVAGVLLLGGASTGDARVAADTTPPTILGPSSFTTAATADCGQTFCTTYTPTFDVSDPDDTASQITVSCNTANGWTFFWGMTMLTCRAQDPAGNLGPPYMATMNVTLPPPTFSPAPGSASFPATGAAGGPATFATPTAIDVGGQSVAVTCDHQSGVVYPIGDTVVTCTAQIKRNDSNGTPIGGLPSATAQFTVTITAGSPGGGGSGGTGGTGSGGSGGSTSGRSGSPSAADTTVPSIQAHSNVAVDATSRHGAVVRYSVAASDPDNNPSELRILCSPASGSTFRLGNQARTQATTVTCTAQDPAGNRSLPLSFEVTVRGAHDQLVALERRVIAVRHLSAARKVTLVELLQDADRDVRTGARAKANQHLGTFIAQVESLSTAVGRGTKTELTTAASRILSLDG